MTPDGRAPDDAEHVFSGRMLGVTLERWGDDEREIVERADSVAVVAVAGGDVVLVRQFRASAGREILELPAGTVNPGEDPLDTAKRELAEETGLGGGRWRPGPVFFSTPGFCRERIHVFVAEDVERRAAPDPGEGEDVETVRWPLRELAARLPEIEDGKTLVGLALLITERG